MVGKLGFGKTSTAKQVYVSVTNTHPIVIQNYLTFDVCDRPFILDDTISKETMDVERDTLRDKIKKSYDHMSRSGIKMFIIITLDQDIEYCYGFVKSVTPCTKDVRFIYLSKALTKGNRSQILRLQFETFCSSEEFDKVERLALAGKNHLLGYPEICTLFCRCSAFQNVGPVGFCNSPLDYLKRYLEDMYNSEGNEKFLMLVYMSLDQMAIDVTAPNDMLFEILRS